MNRMAAKNQNQRKTKPSGRKAKRAKSRAAAKPLKNDADSLAVLNSDKLKELYSTMVKCRMFAARVQVQTASLESSGTGRSMSNREAVLVGATTHLVAGDSISLAHSSFLADFIRGTPLELILAQLAAKGSASRSDAAGTTRRGSPSQLSMAAGMTLAHAIKEKAKVALVFPGEDSAALAFIHDGLALAAKYSLPLVCFIESRSSLEPTAAIDYTAIPPGPPAPPVPRITVNGVDAVAIFRVAQEAVRRARAGHGPSLIECLMTDDNNYASSDGPQDGLHDPITFMEHYLKRRHLWSDEWQRKIFADFAGELDQATAKHPANVANHFEHV
jgi:pyruvate dehydrogenase E1 component alpha subunit